MINWGQLSAKIKRTHPMEALESDTKKAAYEGLEPGTEYVLSQQFDHLRSDDTFQSFNVIDTLQVSQDGLSDVDRAVIMEGAVMSSWLRHTKVLDSMVTLRTNEDIDVIDDRLYIGEQILNEVDAMLKEHAHQAGLIQKQILERSARLDSAEREDIITNLNTDIDHLQTAYGINEEKGNLLKDFKSHAHEDAYQFLVSIQTAMDEVKPQVLSIVNEINTTKLKTAELERVSNEQLTRKNHERADTVIVDTLDDPTKLALGVVKKMLADK